MGYIWAKWAWVRTGQQWMGPIRVVYGLSGQGSTISGCCMGYVWAQWAWVRTGQPHLVPVRVLYGLSGRRLDLVTRDWLPYGQSMGYVGMG